MLIIIGSTSWYKPGQSWDTVLGEVSSSMEECRADTVGLYRKSPASTTVSPATHLIRPLVCSNLDILKIFKYTDQQDIDDIQYITFLLTARAGLRALEFYDPANKKHGQAHMQARCVPLSPRYAR